MNSKFNIIKKALPPKNKTNSKGNNLNMEEKNYSIKAKRKAIIKFKIKGKKYDNRFTHTLKTFFKKWWFN